MNIEKQSTEPDEERKARDFAPVSRYLYSGEIAEEHKETDTWMRGWIHDVRNLGGIAFILLRDKDMVFQVTVIKKMNKELFKEITNLPRESVVAVFGTVQLSEKVMNGFELLAKDFELITRSKAPLPLGVADKVDADMDTRFDNRFLDLRKPEISALFRIRSTMLGAMRNVLLKDEFLEVNTPKIVATATEGGTELFPIKYFEKEAYLNQSPQLYKQMLMATGLDRIFEVAPAFRAEKHDTIHHLNEFLSLDIEMAYATMQDVMAVLEKMIKHIYTEVLENHGREIELLKMDPENLKSILESSFPVVSYDECITLLQKKGFKIEWGEDLSMEASKLVAENYPNFYFITNWPSEMKPFYALPMKDDPRLCHSFDLMFREEELTSGAQRVHDPKLLEERLREKDLDPSNFESYIKAFRYGMPYHSGWGLGVDRTLMILTNQKNVRECVLFPRDRYRLTP